MGNKLIRVDFPQNYNFIKEASIVHMLFFAVSQRYYQRVC
jgi:hypothetical protein